MKKQMNYANRRHIPFVVLVGDEELSSKKFTLKDMNTGGQETLDFETLLNRLQ